MVSSQQEVALDSLIKDLLTKGCLCVVDKDQKARGFYYIFLVAPKKWRAKADPQSQASEQVTRTDEIQIQDHCLRSSEQSNQETG